MAVHYGSSQKESKEDINIEDATSNDRKGTHWMHTCSPQYILLITIVGAILASVITLIVVLVTRYPASKATSGGDNNYSTTSRSIDSSSDANKFLSNVSPSLYPVDPNATFVLPSEFEIVTRKEWLAQPPTDPGTPLKSPVPNVIIMHTATDNCLDIGTCTFHVRYIQSFHIDSRGWWDIGYNWLVGGDGYAYEGRGWTSQGANVYGYNENSIGIAFIGSFNQIMPPERQITAAKQLIKIGVEKGYIAKDYKLLAASQLQETRSPGLLLYEDMKKWPHWSEKP
ncbi:hypothetical protein ILUMI_08110 [Ignelater luminosus]|uniref:Uncharacterized protein n=1 Tax=Ignelater luminosus TaxID=2038154 RepID=A0A8K0D6Q9_IGNLU|nr:hypothetical protein ILUMI_08110 [Ignelater luminosus]